MTEQNINLNLHVLYEDNHLIAVNKPVGIPVQSDSSGDITLHDIVSNYIKTKYNKPGDVYLGLVHRVDRPVSGVVLFARTSKALTRMNDIFRDRKVTKTYLAVTTETPEILNDRLEHYIIKDSEKNKSFASIKAKKNAKNAILHYETIGKSNKFTLLKVNLETGRHHQIRCQLAKINCPIRGDLKYGAPRSNTNGGINLHAFKVSFEHPVQKEPIEITAPAPMNDTLWKEFKEIIKSI